MPYIQLCPKLGVSSMIFFKKHKITFEIGHIKVKWEKLTIVILEGQALKKTTYAIRVPILSYSC